MNRLELRVQRNDPTLPPLGQLPFVLGILASTPNVTTSEAKHQIEQAAFARYGEGIMEAAKSETVQAWVAWLALGGDNASPAAAELAAKYLDHVESEGVRHLAEQATTWVDALPRVSGNRSTLH